MTGAARIESVGARFPEISIRDWANDVEAWNRFVDRSAGSTFSHLAGWNRIMSEVLGHECIYLVATDRNGEWRGVLPLVRVRSVLGHYLISLPFLNDGGPLGDDSAKRELVKFAVEKAKESGATLVELRSREDAPGPVVPSRRKISVHLELPTSVDELWKRTLRPKLRSQIRRPAKEGMTFRSGSGELDAFYRVFARNMRDLGTPALPRKFFTTLDSTFESGVLFAAVYNADQRPVAGACCLLWKGELEVTWASSLREYNQFSPNMLLYGRLMEDAISLSATTFNFGRCTPGTGTHSFKQQWGGRDVELPWPSWTKHENAHVPSATSPFYRLAIAAWQHLPMAAANAFSPFLARLLP